jgi:hypothetical protein
VAKKTKVPKKIAGVKVPKALRKSDLVAGLLSNPAARTVLADVLLAAAGAAAAALARQGPSGTQVAEAGEATLAAGGRAASAATRKGGDVAAVVGGVLAEGAHLLISGQPKNKKRKDRDGAQAH